MQRVAFLEGAALNLTALREDCRSELINLLTALHGRKCLVLDGALGGLLNHVIPEGAKLLREKGVVYFRQLTSGEHGAFRNPSGDADLPDHIVYLVRPNVSNMKVISEHIKEGVRAGIPNDFVYKIYFVPKQSLMCQQVLQDLNVLSRIEINYYPLDLIPLDTDLLSLELDEESSRSLLGPAGGSNWACDGGSGIATVARSLIRLQAMYGTIPNVKAIGSNSAAALRLSMRIRKEEWDPRESALLSGAINPEIDTIIMLDRCVDFVSPLVTPLTYEGLIDELIGISNGFVKLDADVLEDDGGENSSRQGSEIGTRQVAVPLNSSDPLYAAIRDLNVEQLGPYLQDKAKEIRQSYSAFRGNKDQSITEIHEFVKKIPGLNQTYKSLNQHIHIAEIVKSTTDGAPFRQRWQTERSMLEGESCIETIENLIYDKAPLYSVLRLFCLQSVTKGGITSQKFDSIRRDIVQTYGYDTMTALGVLESAGLLRRGGLVWVVDSNTGASWTTARKVLRLIIDLPPSNVPTDMAYVCAGYAPLSARLVQALAGGGGFDVGAVIRTLPGPYLDFKQEKVPVDLHVALSRAQVSSRMQNVQSVRRKVLLVYYVGGITFMEIAALRFLNSQAFFPFHIIIATTKLISGETFLKRICPSLDNRLSLE